MLFLIYLSLLFSVPGPPQQDEWLKEWDIKVIEKANTALGAEYLSTEEKKVFLLTNLARMNGPLFTETILKTYLKDRETSRYTRSLQKDLKGVKNLDPLVPQEDLYQAARSHALKSGKNATTGHQGFEKRFKPMMNKYNAVAENCAYGYDRAIDIVMGLLIDEGVKELGHRKNMLNPVYNSLGVSIEDHKSYRYNCVMEFGRRKN